MLEMMTRKPLPCLLLILFCCACKSAPAPSPTTQRLPPPVIAPLNEWTQEDVLILEFEFAGGGDALMLRAGDGEFDYAVDWDNDGVWDETGLTGHATHKYSDPPPSRRQRIRIAGKFPHAMFCDEYATSYAHLVDVTQ